jgi:predicted  nucleic acid-binding Zn-ribbon protein
MNRTILIVICDFLLVSLLAFSTVDINKTTEDRGTVEVKVDMAAAPTNQADSGRDLAAVMKLALDDEQKRRDLLLGELERTRASATEREKQLQSIEQRLQATEQQRTSLQQQFVAAQTNIATLSQQVRASSSDATISKERLAAMEAELRKRAEEAAALQQRLTSLAQSNQTVLSEKHQLATQLQVAEVEKRHATEQVVAMKEQVLVEREEKAKLADSVKSLATNSTQLVQEIRENRPLAPNTIFDEFSANRVRASFNAYRSGLFDTNKRKETTTVLVSDGTNTYALCHVEDTPLVFWIPSTQWESLTGTLSRETGQVPIRSLAFHYQDPRIVFMPVPAADAQKLTSKVYRISTTPFRFQEAVLVGADASYYGECKFEIDPGTPAYVKLDRSLLKGLFGKFNPSRGDLVFSRTGELLGIMANSTYCLLIKNFDAATSFEFGPDVRAQKTGDTLAALYNIVQQMPLKLQ